MCPSLHGSIVYISCELSQTSGMGKPMANKYAVVGWAQVWAIVVERDLPGGIFVIPLARLGIEQGAKIWVVGWVGLSS